MPEQVKPEAKPETPQVPEELILTLKFKPKTNELSVDGPLHNEMFCVWLLDKAKDFIKAFNMTRNQSQIVKPKGIMDFVRHKRF